MLSARINQHQHFLYYTDLEPDDVVSIMMFAQQISKQARPSKIAFLVGEGNSAIKVARMQQLIDELKKLHLLQQADISIIQGYSEFNGTQKGFNADGLDSLTEKEIEDAKKTLPDGSDAKVKQMAREQIKRFLADNSNVLVISLKPMHELQDIANEDSSIFNQHVLACTGSYNFRSTYWGATPEAEAANQQQLVKLIKSFAHSFIYETYSTTETNSISSANAPEFFALVKDAKPNTLLAKFHIFMANWKNHLLAVDRKYLPETLKKLAAIISTEHQQKFLTALNQDYSKTEGDALSQIMTEAQTKYADNKEIFPLLQRLNRLLGKWKSITQVPLQMVSSDPGLIATLSGDCDAHMSVQPIDIGFHGQYTLLKQPTTEVTTFAYLPGAETTLEKYLQVREAKSSELKTEQAALFSDISRAITDTGRKINQLSLSQPQAVATSVRLAGGSPLHSTQAEKDSVDSSLQLSEAPRK